LVYENDRNQKNGLYPFMDETMSTCYSETLNLRSEDELLRSYFIHSLLSSIHMVSSRNLNVTFGTHRDIICLKVNIIIIV